MKNIFHNAILTIFLSTQTLPIVAVILLSCGAGCVANPESDVVAYVAVDEEFSRPILDGFDRSNGSTTGVTAKFDVESTKTVGLVNRIIAESDRPVCDVFWNNEVLHTIRLQQRGLLAKHSFNIPATFPTGMVASDGTWCGFAARARILIINTDLLPNPEQWPSSVDDLTDPKWSGRCAMARPMFGTTATQFAVLASVQGVDQTIQQLKQIQQNATILSGNKQVALSVSGGQHAWGLTDTDDAIVEMDQGYPVKIVFPDQLPQQAGTMRIPNTVAILRSAPHPVAAGLLADYLVSPETEDRLAMGDSSQIPLHVGTKFPPRVLPTTSVRWMRVDFEAAAADWDDWIQRVGELF